jgi:hypothetical protein
VVLIRCARGWSARYAKVLQHRPNRLAQVVDLDQPDLVVIADPAERPDKISRLHRPPGPGGEDKSNFWPGDTHLSAVTSLPLGLAVERLANDVEQREIPLACLRLQRS